MKDFSQSVQAKAFPLWPKNCLLRFEGSRKRSQVKMDFGVVIKIAFPCEHLLTLFTGEGPCYEFLSVVEAKPLLRDTFHTDHKQMFCWYQFLFSCVFKFPFCVTAFSQNLQKKGNLPEWTIWCILRFPSLEYDFGHWSHDILLILPKWRFWWSTIASFLENISSQL